jgi:hypothetical protein
VLAQLEGRPDVRRAEVDRHGELLRVTLRAGAGAAAIRAALEQMGFAAEEAPDAVTSAVRWYGRSSVGELSREESAVIASRVVLQFGVANGLAQTDIDPSRRAWLRLCMSASSGTATPGSRRVGWPAPAGERSRRRRARSSARMAPHCSDVRSKPT